MRRSALDQYLIELVDQNTSIEGMRRLIADPPARDARGPPTMAKIASGCDKGKMDQQVGIAHRYAHC